MKKVLATLLALIMCFGVGVTVHAEETGHEVVIPFKYLLARKFSEGVAPVHFDGWGFIDTSGNEAIPFVYGGAWPFSEGLAAVMKDNKWGYIDIVGNEIIPFIYDNALTFSEGLAAVWKDGKWGYIDTSGNEVLPFIYDSALTFSEGLAYVKIGNMLAKYFVIDTSGNEITPIHSGIGWDGFSENLAAASLNSKWGYIDTSGNEIIPFIYDRVGPFSENLAAVNLDDKWGFIDKMGNEIIPFIYDRVILSLDQTYVGFSEGLAAVGLNEKWGYIDIAGNEVVPFIYDDVEPFSEGLAAVKLGDNWGFITPTSNAPQAPAAQTTTAPAPAIAAQDGGIIVKYNGVTINFTQPPTERNGFAFYPLEDVMEAFAGGHGWDGETFTVSGEKNGNLVEIPLNNLAYWINGVKLECPGELVPFVENERTYVYLDYIVEGLGLSVSWDGSTRTISIAD